MSENEMIFRRFWRMYGLESLEHIQQMIRWNPDEGWMFNWSDCRRDLVSSCNRSVWTCEIAWLHFRKFLPISFSPFLVHSQFPLFWLQSFFHKFFRSYTSYYIPSLFHKFHPFSSLSTLHKTCWIQSYLHKTKNCILVLQSMNFTLSSYKCKTWINKPQICRPQELEM